MGINRRNFVKGCVGLGMAGGLGAFTLGAGRPVSDVQVDIQAITFPAIRVIKGSPAPYGLALIPTRIEDGELIGIPDAVDHQLDWYKYCAHERAPGLEPGFESDNKLRFFVTEEKIHKGFEAWFTDRLDEPIKAADFPLPTDTAGGVQGPHGAPFNWRSEGVDAENTLTGIVVAVPRDQLEYEKLSGFTEAQLSEWFPTHPDDENVVFVSFISFCTHFCCVPGWKETELAKNSSRGPYADLWETVFCSCHLSAYDPLRIQTYQRNIFIFRNADGEEGGAAGEGGGNGGH